MSQILRPKHAASMLDIALSTLYRWEKRSDFPKRIKLGPSSSGWRKAELEQWLDRQASEAEEVKQ